MQRGKVSALDAARGEAQLRDDRAGARAGRNNPLIAIGNQQDRFRPIDRLEQAGGGQGIVTGSRRWQRPGE
jgi:hypothetical protein